MCVVGSVVLLLTYIIIFMAFLVFSCIDGIRLIAKEPQSLGLRSDLRDELGYPSRKKSKEKKDAPTKVLQIPDDGEYVESMWLMVNRLDGDVIHGEVNNEPVNIKKVQLGTRMKVGRDRIQDWMFNDGKIMNGGFTAKVVEAVMKGE